MIFHSRDPFYKSVPGAVAAGTAVSFCLSLPSPCVRYAELVVRFDGEQEQAVALHCEGVYWKGEYCFDRAGLYFYYFRYRNHGSDFLYVLTRGQRGMAVESDKAPCWQQTVYDPDYETPRRYLDGVMYQIFPDRFFASGKPKVNVPMDRYLHPDISEPVAFAPTESDPKGNVLNNDYYGGDLAGITQKLGYLKDLGVRCIYLNPIFEAHSNHRYNTANYLKIDPLLGNEQDFEALCHEAEKLGMGVILDGVFSHTGSDSIYFNREGRYTGGAWADENSPYRDWYTFGKNRSYRSWWGFETLPEVNETSSFLQFICGEGGVLQHWLRKGAAGVRLDVADELPDEFLDAVRARLKAENKENYLLGEVWEDATNKEAYGIRRRYLLGKQLDAVMNYPFRDAILRYACSADAAYLCETVELILEHYPPQAMRVLMNHLGTHDTVRLLTALGGEAQGSHDRQWQSQQSLSKEQYRLAVQRLKTAVILQYTLPGIPCIYYGDEAGMQGYADPFNRGCYPWGDEDAEILRFYRAMGKIKIYNSCLDGGDYRTVFCKGSRFSYLRENQNGALYVCLDPNGAADSIPLPDGWETAETLLRDQSAQGQCRYLIIRKGA